MLNDAAYNNVREKKSDISFTTIISAFDSSE